MNTKAVSAALILLAAALILSAGCTSSQMPPAEASKADGSWLVGTWVTDEPAYSDNLDGRFTLISVHYADGTGFKEYRNNNRYYGPYFFTWTADESSFAANYTEEVISRYSTYDSCAGIKLSENATESKGKRLHREIESVNITNLWVSDSTGYDPYAEEPGFYRYTAEFLPDGTVNAEAFRNGEPAFSHSAVWKEIVPGKYSAEFDDGTSLEFFIADGALVDSCGVYYHTQQDCPQSIIGIWVPESSDPYYYDVLEKETRTFAVFSINGYGCEYAYTPDGEFAGLTLYKWEKTEDGMCKVSYLNDNSDTVMLEISDYRLISPEGRKYMQVMPEESNVFEGVWNAEEYDGDSHRYKVLTLLSGGHGLKYELSGGAVSDSSELTWEITEDKCRITCGGVSSECVIRDDGTLISSDGTEYFR